MRFRPTSAKTSGEKNFRKIFYWPKRTAFEFHGDSWGVIFTLGYIKWPKITKNTPLDFKIQKKTQLLKPDGSPERKSDENKLYLRLHICAL